MEKVKTKKGKSMRVTSIKFKLLRIIIPVVIIMVGVLVLFSYKISKGLLENSSHDLLELSVSKQATQIEAWLNENLASFKMAKQNIETTKPDSTALQAVIDGYYGFNPNFKEGIYIAGSDGSVIKASQSGLTINNVTDSVWYKQGITRKNMAYTSSYKNDDGNDVVSATGILNDGSGVLKVISADLSIDKISIIVNSFIDMEGAHAFLVDRDTRNIIAHRESSLISTGLGDNKGDKYFTALDSKISKNDLAYSSIEGNMTVFEDNKNEYPEIKYKFIGIVFNTYIIIEIKDEMYIIDQHAAHERILYEKVKNRIGSNCSEGGSNLSGGEKQRIAIARAILRNSPVLLLDEIISALDGITAEIIERNLLKMEEKTIVFVTHKIESEFLKRADCIFCMDQGMIIESGSWDALIKEKGYFYKLYAARKNKIEIKNLIFQNPLIFQGLPPIKYQNLMYFPLFLPL